jgi:hypothetical protein
VDTMFKCYKDRTLCGYDDAAPSGSVAMPTAASASGSPAGAAARGLRKFTLNLRLLSAPQKYTQLQMIPTKPR